MKFLLDVHVSTRIATALSDSGHDVVRAALHDPTASDRDLLAFAVSESRVIVTQDSDFSELIFAWGCPAPQALIYIRSPPAEQPGMSERVLEAIAMPTLEGHVAVITPAATRLRPFPQVE